MASRLLTQRLSRSRWSTCSSSLAAASVCGGFLLAAPSLAHQDASGRDEEAASSSQGSEKLKKDGVRYIGVFFDETTVSTLHSKLKINHPPTRKSHAVIHLHPSDEDTRVYAPLFGAKAKVHVKGVAEDFTHHQQFLLVDVRVADGPVTPSKYLPVIALKSERWEPDVSDILASDLARRLDEEGVLKKKEWEGVLPRQEIDGLQYDVAKAKFSKVEPPVVVEGIVCSSLRFKHDRHECNPLALSNREGGQAATREDSGEEGEEVEGECPLCTYMKASPCKDVFMVFKDCIDSAATTEEKEDLNRCEASAKLVHECIMENDLFREFREEEEEEGGAELEEGRPEALAKSPTLKS